MPLNETRPAKSKRRLKRTQRSSPTFRSPLSRPPRLRVCLAGRPKTGAMYGAEHDCSRRSSRFQRLSVILFSLAKGPKAPTLSTSRPIPTFVRLWSTGGVPPILRASLSRQTSLPLYRRIRQRLPRPSGGFNIALRSPGMAPRP